MTKNMMESILLMLGDTYSASPMISCMMAISPERGFAVDGYEECLLVCENIARQAA